MVLGSPDRRHRSPASTMSRASTPTLTALAAAAVVAPPSPLPPPAVQHLLTAPRKQLTSLEAERVVSVLSTTGARLRLAQALYGPNIDGTLRRLDGSVPHAVLEAVQAHKQLQLGFRRLPAQRDALRASVCAIVHTLTGHPRAVQLLLEPAAMAGSADVAPLRSAVEGLRELLFTRLLTTVAEDKEREAETAILAARDKRIRSELSDLETALAEATLVREEKSASSDEIMAQLSAEIDDLNAQADSYVDRVERDVNKKILSEKTAQMDRAASLQSTAHSLQSAAQAQQAQHRAAEVDLRKRRFKMESEIRNWIMKYDQEMGEKQDEIDDITKHYTDELDQLRELSERFDATQEEYNAILAEQQRAREIREKSEAELNLFTKAASRIQRFWRRYRMEKDARLKSGKKKKGSAGKKGSGKKKKK